MCNAPNIAGTISSKWVHRVEEMIDTCVGAWTGSTSVRRPCVSEGEAAAMRQKASGGVLENLKQSVSIDSLTGVP